MIGDKVIREETRMKTFSKKTPKEKEWQKLEKLQITLDVAFAKAFTVIFEKGTGVIEKTYYMKNIMEYAELKYRRRLV